MGRGGFALPLVRLGAFLALAALLAACTKGGQFDPTTVLDNDMFDSKKPLQGQRESVFPNGVPGATTGIPADLYKGYQPPPEQAADAGGAAIPITPGAAEPPKPVAKLEPRPRRKPKPRPKEARAPAPPRTEISVGLPKHETGAQRRAQPAQTAWPTPPSNAAAQTAWPSPTAQSQPAQTAWPSPTAGAQQSAQPSQSIWPNPTSSGTQ